MAYFTVYTEQKLYAPYTQNLKDKKTNSGAVRLCSKS